MQETKNDVLKKLKEESKSQIVSYACCGKVFAACVDGYQDAEWDRNVRKYRTLGHKVETVERSAIQFGKCECTKEPKKKVTDQLELL